VVANHGCSLDVFDRGSLHRGIERLDLLPEPGSRGEPFDFGMVAGYHAIVVVGPWQNPRAMNSILRARRDDQPLLYLPRGGLGRIEFARPRDIKKWPYFFLLERRLIDAASAIVFSSECERRNTIGAARGRTREVVIADLFRAPDHLARAPGPAPGEVRFSFMAEISPRKALLPAIEAFHLLAENPAVTVPVRLVVGGSVRKGSEAYAQRARDLAARVPSAGKVAFVGPVAHGSRPEFYRDTDVFLVPSLFESFGLTVLEALAAGCATIAGPNLGVLEFLPPHDRLGVATAVEPEPLAAEMLRQYRMALTRQEAARAATSGYGQNAVGAMNADAIRSWLALLGT
jgi:glycosyltransferase involved in cell wall biosynthesis